MLSLPNNCRCGNFSVFPFNWKSPRANKNLTWRITYWFFDDNLNQKKQVLIKGMNMLETLREKQDTVKLAIEDEIYQLKERGYNQITKTYLNNDSDVSEFTPFIDALDYALTNLHAEHQTKLDVKSCLRYITKAIQVLHYDRLTISQVRRKHIRFILEQCGKVNQKWSANLFNHYRANLSMLFRQLVEIDVVDVNPCREISKRAKIKKIRETLSKEERVTVDIYLHDNYYEFWRFVQIFFHSGTRIIELLRVRKKDVDLQKQQFKITMKKGSKSQEELRTIKTIALPFWNEIISLAKGDQILFSRGLVPGSKIIRREQVTKRWKNHVKHKLGITGDLYSLKHSNIDEVADKLGIKSAQEMAGHSTPVVTMIYATGEKERKHNRLKEIDNAF